MSLFTTSIGCRMTLKKQQEFTDVFSLLPTNLIMDIIKIADGGLNLHKKSYKGVMGELLGLNALEYIEDGCPHNEAFMEVLKGQDTCIEGVNKVCECYYIHDIQDVIDGGPDDQPLTEDEVWNYQKVLDKGKLWIDRLGLNCETEENWW
jgi:hypothetical protein